MNSLGSIILVNRLTQNMSIQALSEISEVDIASISRIEHDTSLHPQKINALLESLDIDVDLSKECLNETNTLLHNLVNQLYTKKHINDEILVINQKYSNKCYSIDLLISNLIGCCFGTIQLTKQQIEFIINILSKTESIMTNFQKKVFTLFSGVYYYTSNNFKKSIILFNKSIEVVSDHRLHALGYYYRGRQEIKQMQLFQAINDMLTANNQFQMDNIYLRDLDIKCALGNIATLIKDYNSAIELYNKAIENSAQFNVDSNFVVLCLTNLLNALVESQQYNAFLKKIKSIDANIYFTLQSREVFIINHIIALYETHQYDACINLIKSKKELVKTIPNSSLIEYITDKIKNSETALNHLLEARSFIKKHKNYSAAPVIYEYISKEYEQAKDYKNLSIILKELNKFTHA